jgi:hypothetical protein
MYVITLYPNILHILSEYGRKRLFCLQCCESGWCPLHHLSLHTVICHMSYIICYTLYYIYHMSYVINILYPNIDDQVCFAFIAAILLGTRLIISTLSSATAYLHINISTYQHINIAHT